MKKQELIHLHGLLVEVQNHREENSYVEAEPEQYAKLGTRPQSIHKSKTKHKEAVFALVRGITNEMDTEAAKTHAVSAD